MIEWLQQYFSSSCFASLTHHMDLTDSPFHDELGNKLTTLAKQRSAEIDDLISNSRRNDRGVMKILLLGGPACGKSTIFKQMQIIHDEGYKDPGELAHFKERIVMNISTSVRQFIRGARILGVDTEEITDLLTSISGYSEPIPLSPFTAGIIDRLWNTKEIQIVYRHRYDIELLDSAKYFMDNVLRIGATDYVPTYEDILHSREATVQIQSKTFMYEKLKLRLVDVGGQRSQRRKWLPLFDDVRVVIFVVDLTGCARKNDSDVYDLPSTLSLFKEVATNRVLRRAIFLLFLNKVDKFKEIIASVDLSKSFNVYTGPAEFEPAADFIRTRFVQAAKPRKSVFPHLTTATNTENIKFVFRACMESVFKASTKATGLV